MDEFCKEAIWNQFKATLDMFGNALQACPDELWTAHLWIVQGGPAGFAGFWYIAYHTLFWLDLYLYGGVEGFIPPEPYTLGELDPRGVLPERVYSRGELLAYLDHCRIKCQQIIARLTDQTAQRVCYFPWVTTGIRFAELLLDNMRHVQEHTAQLNMFLGQQMAMTSKWIGWNKA